MCIGNCPGASGREVGYRDALGSQGLSSRDLRLMRTVSLAPRDHSTHETQSVSGGIHGTAKGLQLGEVGGA